MLNSNSKNLSPFVWLFAGVLAVAGVLVVVPAVMHNYWLSPPDDINKVFDKEPSEAEIAEYKQVFRDTDTTNTFRILVAVSVVTGTVFSIFAGWGYRRPKAAGVAIVTSLVSAFVLAGLLGPLIISLQEAGKNGAQESLAHSVGLHSIQWLVVGVVSAVAIGIASGDARLGAFSLGIFALSAVLAATAYAIGGTLLHPGGSYVVAAPVGGMPLLLWSLSPLIGALFLFRAFRSQNEPSGSETLGIEDRVEAAE